jgi:hypothetical protein
MAYPAAELKGDLCYLDFDRRLKLKFYGSKVIGDVRLLACNRLDGPLGLTSAAAILSDLRLGRLERRQAQECHFDLRGCYGPTVRRMLCSSADFRLGL